MYVIFKYNTTWSEPLIESWRLGCEVIRPLDALKSNTFIITNVYVIYAQPNNSRQQIACREWNVWQGNKLPTSTIRLNKRSFSYHRVVLQSSSSLFVSQRYITYNTYIPSTCVDSEAQQLQNFRIDNTRTIWFVVLFVCRYLDEIFHIQWLYLYLVSVLVVTWKVVTKVWNVFKCL